MKLPARFRDGDLTPKLLTVLREGYGLPQLRADLVAGLTVLTYGVFNRFDTRVLTMLFGCFFLSGVLLFAASAFINTETVKTFLNATGILKGAGR